MLSHSTKHIALRSAVAALAIAVLIAPAAAQSGSGQGTAPVAVPAQGHGGIPGGVIGGVPGGVAGGSGHSYSLFEGELQSGAMSTDEEVKMMALNGLRNASPDAAVPVLDRFLREKHSDRLRERALAVLSGFGTAAARDVVARVAGDASNLPFQAKAIRYLARFEGEETRKMLMDIYAASSSADVKRAIIRTLAGVQDISGVLSLARAEQESGVRSYAISQLGSMNARAELADLYRTQVDVEARTSVVRAMGAARDVEALARIAGTETISPLRREAIRRVSTIPDEEAGKALLALYATEKDADLRKEILRGLARQGNITALIALARQESDPDLRRYAVARIAESRSKEATDFLAELLK